MNLIVKLVKIAKKSLHKIGLDVHQFIPHKNPALQLLKGLNRFDIDLVFDIGANTGQFASELRYVGYKGRIVSFEPLTDAHRTLGAAAAGDHSWEVHRRCAIGDFDGEIEINIANNLLSSSVLPMLDAHTEAAAGSDYIGRERVPLCRLDSVATEYLREGNRFFVKIDTQGFEWQLLDGGSETFKRAQGVLCEMSLVPLYQGQRLWVDVMQRLERAGFTLWSIQTVFTNPHDGRTLQIDGIFFRTESLPAVCAE